MRGVMRSHARLSAQVIAGLALAYLSLHFTQADHGWLKLDEAQLAEARPEDQQRPSGSKGDYDLQELTTLQRALTYVEENYVEPDRINRRKMIGAALQEVQRVVPEVMVEVQEDKDKLPSALVLKVNGGRETIPVSMVSTRYHLIFAFKDIFGFIQNHLRHFKDLREIEYAAINGLLSTLDPHSVLLPPEAYREMRVNTQGKFGGLGIVIGVRDNLLTIINPIEDTPASRAGLRAGDHIVQINLDSTMNMSLTDAVDLMRGDPGTEVTIHVTREGWQAPRAFKLVRDQIKVKSVKALDVGSGILVARVSNFQSTTVDELREAIESLGAKPRGKPLKGLILDLRNNPGGLLDQATKMADLFISEGTLVKTVGFGDKVREPKLATKAGTIEDLPIVVLINAASASASEIVAGALKNHERALVVGQRSFGKGSVQLLFDNPDESALKLTIAQYLTPGDISIQSVGVTPTVALSPALLTDEETYFYGNPEEERGEAALPEHLVSDKSEVSKAQRPQLELRYLQDAEVLKKQREQPNDIIVDFELEFARDLLKVTKGPSLSALMQSAERLVSEQGAAQEALIDARLKGQGVSWSSKVGSAPARGEARVSLSPAGGVVRAGETLEVSVTVTNTSSAPLHKVRGMSESENSLFKGYEFLLGHIPPGESRSWRQQVKVSHAARDRSDEVRVVFSADGAGEVGAVTFGVEVKAPPPPRFALRYTLNDAPREGSLNNGDGLLNPGEEVEMRLSFENRGEGESLELVGHLSNEGRGVAPGLFITQGRVQPEAQVLRPKERGALSFRFKVKEGWSEPTTKVYLTLMDAKLRESTSELLTLRVDTTATLRSQEATLRPLSPAAPAIARSQPSMGAAIASSLSSARAEACLYEGDQCAWWRVREGDGGAVWVSAAEVRVEEGATQVAQPAEPLFMIAPPQVTLSALPSVIEGGEALVRGEVSSALPLEDIIIYVGQRKVFFMPQSEMSSPTRATFEVRAPLEEGVNMISVYARVSEHLSSQVSRVVRRPKAKP
jgi:carboxyl-terminal processing protease